MRKPTVRELSEMTRPDFVAVCGKLFEHSPWIAEATWADRPFASRRDLHHALCRNLRASDEDRKLSLIRAHPDLVGKLSREGALTAESTREQASAGLGTLSTEEVALFGRYNAEYRGKFGFPFVICARENKKEAILSAFSSRLENPIEREIETALTEIEKIAWLRLVDATSED